MTTDEIQAIPGIGPAIYKAIIKAIESFTGQPYVPPEKEPEITFPKSGDEAAKQEDTAESTKPVMPDMIADGLDERDWVIETDILRKSEERKDESDSPEETEITSGSSRMIAREVKDFPDPDSPTNANISPCLISRDSLLMAWVPDA